MKRLAFVFCIIAVMAVVAFYVYVEFSVVPIVYVSDTSEVSSKGNETVIYRKYSSRIDVDEFIANMEESLVDSDFTEEEMMAAALASGTPMYYPAFFLGLYQSEVSRETYSLRGTIGQGYFERQMSGDYTVANVTLEVVSGGMYIADFSYKLTDENVESSNVPIISEDKLSMAINLDNVKEFSIQFDSAAVGGTATLRYTYDIVTTNIISSPVLEDQLLIVYANITKQENNVLQVSFISEPYASLEDYEE